jgi:hypothetical protein
MSTALWEIPQIPRGRRIAGMPGEAEWLAQLPRGWWVQADPEDGPIFCRWVPTHSRGVAANDWWQVLLGPDDWSGVWAVHRGMPGARQFRVTSVWTGTRWQPMAHFGKGNLSPVENWQADATPDLRDILVREGLCTPSEWDRYTGFRLQREQAARTCRTMIWMC